MSLQSRACLAVSKDGSQHPPARAATTAHRNNFRTMQQLARRTRRPDERAVGRPTAELPTPSRSRSLRVGARLPRTPVTTPMFQCNTCTSGSVSLPGLRHPLSRPLGAETWRPPCCYSRTSSSPPLPTLVSRRFHSYPSPGLSFAYCPRPPAPRSQTPSTFAPRASVPPTFWLAPSHPASCSRNLLLTSPPSSARTVFLFPPSPPEPRTLRSILVMLPAPSGRLELRMLRLL